MAIVRAPVLIIAIPDLNKQTEEIEITTGIIIQGDEAEVLPRGKGTEPWIEDTIVVTKKKKKGTL